MTADADTPPEACLYAEVRAENGWVRLVLGRVDGIEHSVLLAPKSAGGLGAGLIGTYTRMAHARGFIERPKVVKVDG